MAEHDISLVTGQAGSVITEGNKTSFGTAGGGLTPSTITAMVGISNGQALDLAPEVKTVMSKLSEAVPATLGVDGFGLPIPNPKYHPGAAAALSNLTTLQGKLGVTGTASTSTLGGFGSFISQAQNHIKDSIELKNATDFVKKIDFPNLGPGITNMSSMVDQGMSSKFGSMTAAASAMNSTGKAFDLGDMANFGQPAGLVKQLTSNKLANTTGLNKALASAGVDINNITDPVYKDTITRVLSNIKDPAVVAKVKDQLDLPSGANLNHLGDILDVNKMAPAGSIGGLNGGFSELGEKFGGLGAKFASPQAASNMLQNIQVPNIPSLNAAAPSLNSLMTSHASTINNMLGSDLTSSPNGIPNITDFAGVVGGGGMMKSLSTSNDISAIVSGVNGQVTKTQSLFSRAGIDLDTKAPESLGSAMNFATGLHKYGADTSGSGISQLLGNMARSGNAFGDSIKASLAEGQNRALMGAAGIKPLDFNGVNLSEGLDNLKQGKFIPGTGAMTQDQIGKIFGGG